MICLHIFNPIAEDEIAFWVVNGYVPCSILSNIQSGTKTNDEGMNMVIVGLFEDVYNDMNERIKC